MPRTTHAQPATPPPAPTSPDTADPPVEQPPPITPPGPEAGDEPALPPGLDDEPALPSGLDGDGEPALPSGLDANAATAAPAAAATPRGIPIDWRVSSDLRAGTRVGDPGPNDRRLSLAELRVQLDVGKSWRTWATTARLVVDAVGDPLADDQTPDVEAGVGAVDLRTASLSLTPFELLDLRIGRQILTWGTGDLMFINDLFPKDWTAFLIGRADDYLKAPSDAVKISVFTPIVETDVVITPRFDPDRLPLRDRLSSWDPALGRVVGGDTPIVVEPRDRWGRDAELAVRLHRTVASWELAAYGYRGFWKSPAGADPMTGAATFPPLSVYGASVRGPVWRGIASTELGWYDSREDRAGADPLIRNSELRGLVGYEHQLARNLTAGVQYYVEWMLHHGRYLASLPPGTPPADQLRHVTTARLTWLALRQQLRFTVFVAASPSDRDLYVRPLISYAWTDRWTVFAGGNVMRGREDHTFFGQLEDNTNAYAGLRYAR